MPDHRHRGAGTRLRRLLPADTSAPEAARLWYEEKYRPTVATGHEATGGLLETITDADIFLALHRQERSAWGGECGEPECVADMLLAEQRRAAAAERSPIDRVLMRDPQPRAPALLLPHVGDPFSGD